MPTSQRYVPVRDARISGLLCWASIPGYRACKGGAISNRPVTPVIWLLPLPPKCLAAQLSTQPCDVLASKEQQLLLKGTLKLLDARARPTFDLYAFLFTDMLLLTEHKTKTCKRDVRCGWPQALSMSGS